MALSFSTGVFDELKRWAEKCYPYEGCGILLGPFGGKSPKKAVRFSPLANLLRDRQNVQSPTILQTASATLGKRVESGGQFEFVMDPREFNGAVLAGEKDGLDVLAIIHTHPDHPAKPSATDAAQPLLAGWSNIIVRVDKGAFVEMKSWVREEERDPFKEEEIIIR